MKHKHETDVADILKQDKAALIRFIDLKRREGMYIYNQQIVEKDGETSHSNSSMMRERKPKGPDSLRMCSECKSFFSNRSYYLHVKKCQYATGLKPKALKLSTLLPVQNERMDRDEDFQKLLNSYSEKPASKLVRHTRIIQKVGWRHFCLRRAEKSKIVEINKCIATEMRELARLFIVFQSYVTSSVTFENMFERRYIENLLDAIDELGYEKHGIKLNIHAILTRTMKTLKGIYSDQSQDDRRSELLKFQEAYSYRIPEVLADARFKNLTQTQKHRRPEELQSTESMQILKTYVSQQIGSLMATAFDISQYPTLRDLLVSRLTLFNARRGEEPSRMTLDEWEDALNDVWLPKENLETLTDPAEKLLMGQFRLVYLHGKGKKYVPVLIPLDTVEPIKLLVSRRNEYGIPESNQFVFATKSGSNHCSGWHAIDLICCAAGVKVTATKTRHLISTIYASLDMNEHDRKTYLDHMGHEEDISKTVYQCPIGVKEVKVMGRMLKLAETTTGSLAETNKDDEEVGVPSFIFKFTLKISLYNLGDLCCGCKRAL